MPWTNASVSPLARRSSCYQCLKAPRGSPPALILGFSNLYVRSKAVGSSARQSVSFPSFRSRARGCVNQERRTFFHPARDVTPTRRVFIHRSSYSFRFPCVVVIARYTHVVVSIASHRIASHRIARNGVPLCDIHPSMVSHTSHASMEPWMHENHTITNTYRTRRRSR